MEVPESVLFLENFSFGVFVVVIGDEPGGESRNWIMKCSVENHTETLIW